MQSPSLFREGELPKSGNMQKVHLAAADRPTTFYSLEVIIGDSPHFLLAARLCPPNPS